MENPSEDKKIPPNKKVCPTCGGSKKITLGFPGWYMGEKDCTECDDNGLVSE